MFGVDNLEKQIWGAKIDEWITAYSFIRSQAIEKLKKGKNKNNSLSKLCISKPQKWWINQLCKYSLKLEKKLSNKTAENIISKLIFDLSSKDLIDNPLVKFGDNLVLIPSVVFQLIPEIALLSNFIQHRVQVNFKGSVFEERIKQKLKQAGIEAQQISAHLTEDKSKNNVETDLVFIMFRTLFIIECKSIIPPYTIRDHVKTNHKIIHEIQKFKKNAEFFSTHLDLVLHKLHLRKDKKIDNIVKIFLTSSTLGFTGKVDDIYLVDEAAFSAFLLRNPPLIRDTDMNIHDRIEHSAYKGEINASKFREFLNEPPSIRFMELFLNRDWNDMNENVSILRYRKEMPTKYINIDNMNFKGLSAENFIYEMLDR